MFWYRRASRQVQRERRALAQFAVDGDRATRLMRKTVHLRKSETGALADRLGGEKRIEDSRQNVGRNTGAGILHGDGDMVAFADVVVDEDIAGVDRHLAAL